MEASQCLNGKNQNIISKVQSGGSTSKVSKTAGVSSSSVIKIRSSVEIFEKNKFEGTKTVTTTTNISDMLNGISGSFLFSLAWLPIK